jgi:UDP-glucose 4-epimerase
MVEQILDDGCGADGLQAISLRYFNPVGAHPSGLLGECSHHCANLFSRLAQASAGSFEHGLVIHGSDFATADGTCVRDYVHVCDIAQGHVLALDKLFEASPDGHVSGSHEAVNLGSGRGHSVLEAVDAYCRAAGRNIPLRLGPRRPGDVAVLVADVSKAREWLGWHPERSLPEACADILRWLEIRGN